MSQFLKTLDPNAIEFLKFALPLIGAVIAWFVNEQKKQALLRRQGDERLLHFGKTHGFKLEDKADFDKSSDHGFSTSFG